MKHLYIVAILSLFVFHLAANAQRNTKNKKPRSSSEKTSASGTSKAGSTAEVSAADGTPDVRDRINQRLKDSTSLKKETPTTEKSTVINGIRVGSSAGTPATAESTENINSNANHTRSSNPPGTSITDSANNTQPSNSTGNFAGNNNVAPSGLDNSGAIISSTIRNDSTKALNNAGSVNRENRASGVVDATILNKNLVNTVNTTNNTSTNTNNNTRLSGGTAANSTPGQVTHVNPVSGVIILDNTSSPGKPVTNEQSQYNSTDLNRAQRSVLNQNQNASAPQNQSATWSQNTNTVGENQWGRNQVGENQLTTPPELIASGFSRDYPAIRGVTWTIDVNKNYGARYKANDLWTTSTYNLEGVRLETRTELPVTATLPQSVITYKSKQNVPVDFSRISKIERPGKPDIYEVKLNSGSVVYLNNAGVEVLFP